MTCPRRRTMNGNGGRRTDLYGLSAIEVEKDNQMNFYIMSKDYRKQLPSGNSQQQGGDNGGRQTVSPRKQEKPDVILQVINKRTTEKGRMVLYDPKEYERRVNDIVEGQMLVNLISNTRDMLGQQMELLSGISLDEMRNNSNKLVNQDMSIEPLEESNRNVETILSKVAKNIYDSKLMMRYVEEMTKKDREKWQLSEVDKAMMTGGDKACAYIEKKADGHLSRLASRMEWFPVKYHLLDKVALVVFTVLGYYTGKNHLDDDLTFLWLLAGMPVLIVSVIWGINELMAWMNGKY